MFDGFRMLQGLKKELGLRSDRKLQSAIGVSAQSIHRIKMGGSFNFSLIERASNITGIPCSEIIKMGEK